MNKHEILGLDHAHQLHNSLGIGMRRKGHVLDFDFNVHNSIVNLNPTLPMQDPVANSASNAIARHDDAILLVSAPLLEDLERLARVQHARGGEDDHGPFGLGKLLLVGLDVLEVEGVPLDKRLLDLLIRPVDKELVVVGRLFGQTGGKVDWHVQLHPVPVRLQQNAQLLCATKGEYRNQNLIYILNQNESGDVYSKYDTITVKYLNQSYNAEYYFRDGLTHSLRLVHRSCNAYQPRSCSLY